MRRQKGTGVQLGVDVDRLTHLLEQVRSCEVDVATALDQLKSLPVEDIGFARLDHHRALRTGSPEIVYGPGKTPTQIASILQRLSSKHSMILCSRASTDAYDEVHQVLPDAEYYPASGAIIVRRNHQKLAPGIMVLTAGTSDFPIAEEVELAAETMGQEVERIEDVGVAGLHRLIAVLDRLRRARVLVVIAGMEGALPSVVAGLVDVPVIGVPTSVGYGASFGGVAALLAMLNSCAAGLGVVNIDNGIGAGILASRINRKIHDSCPAGGES
jgi:pyridinium-3,5-biscarboxylic acid mononucleotide synthase